MASRLDCIDREIISYLAATGGIDNDLIRNLMLEAFAVRFGDVQRSPQSIEWLIDNGLAYTAMETRLFGMAVRLQVRTTLFDSPESNRMTIAFVKTLTRDYVQTYSLCDTPWALEEVPNWFKDYN